MNLQIYLDRYYDKIFHKVCEDADDTLHELLLEVQLSDGTTYRRSWRDREERLANEEKPHEVRR